MATVLVRFLVLVSLVAGWLVGMGAAARADATGFRGAPDAVTVREVLSAPAAMAPPAAGKLAASWCGTPTAVDDVAHETGERSLAKFKVIDAYPVDVAQSGNRPHEIQAAVMQVFDHLLAESGGRKSVRLDLGTRCGPAYVDIQTIPLDGVNESYCLTHDLFAEVGRKVGDLGGPRNLLIFLAGDACGGVGVATMAHDDRPGAANVHNSGGYMAQVSGVKWTTALHEMGHTLGAVQLSAPHNDAGQSYHCWDGKDIMCYIGLPVGPTVAAPICQAEPAPFDCNGDDYFNPEPPAGSYLATHWNIFDSVFLCEAALCTPSTPAGVVGPPAPAGFGPSPVVVDHPPAARRPAPKPARKRRCAKRRASGRRTTVRAGERRRCARRGTRR